MLKPNTADHHEVVILKVKHGGDSIVFSSTPGVSATSVNKPLITQSLTFDGWFNHILWENVILTETHGGDSIMLIRDTLGILWVTLCIWVASLATDFWCMVVPCSLAWFFFTAKPWFILFQSSLVFMKLSFFFFQLYLTNWVLPETGFFWFG